MFKLVTNVYMECNLIEVFAKIYATKDTYPEMVNVISVQKIVWLVLTKHNVPHVM